ncbi:MAG TPA: hypothetical protein VEC19_02495 [Usitatibacter sp.]|nr:hypothetical protein [Usitatibacter sp.]
MKRLYEATATLLPVLLGQGLIYLYTAGRLSGPATILAIVAMATLILSVAAAARRLRDERILRNPAHSSYAIRQLRLAQARG